MDGTYRVTICGDPLYFAPEVVSQQGYDYAMDLWAFGIVIYEMYEGQTPFGNSDTDETTIFRGISAFRTSRLKFSKTPTAARKLITSLLTYGSEERAGYRDPYAICGAEYFNGMLYYIYISSLEHFLDYDIYIYIYRYRLGEFRSTTSLSN
jgi:protein kinase A